MLLRRARVCASAFVWWSLPWVDTDWAHCNSEQVCSSFHHHPNKYLSPRLISPAILYENDSRNITMTVLYSFRIRGKDTRRGYTRLAQFKVTPIWNDVINNLSHSISPKEATVYINALFLPPRLEYWMMTEPRQPAIVTDWIPVPWCIIHHNTPFLFQSNLCLGPSRIKDGLQMQRKDLKHHHREQARNKEQWDYWL